MRIVTLLFLILAGCSNVTPTPTQPPPTPTSNTSILESQLAAIDWIDTINGISIQSLEEGGSQTLINLTITDPAQNNMDNATTIYAYALESIFELPQPAPMFISIILIDDTQRIGYEQMGEETQLTASVLESP